MSNKLKTPKKNPSFIVKMFMDENDINEKSIVGFGAFLMLVITASVDLVTGYYGKQLTIHEFIFDGFMIITLGSFGIASVDKYVTLRNSKKTDEGISDGVSDGINDGV